MTGCEDESFVYVHPSLEIERLRRRCEVFLAMPPPPDAACPPVVLHVQSAMRGWIARVHTRRAREYRARTILVQWGARLSLRAHTRALHRVAQQRILGRMAARAVAEEARRASAAVTVQRNVRGYLRRNGALPRSRLLLELMRLRRALEEERLRTRKRHRKRGL